jgi:hypothetical protein
VCDEGTGVCRLRTGSKTAVQHGSNAEPQQYAHTWHSESRWHPNRHLLPLQPLPPPLDGQAIEDFPRNRRRLDGRDNRCKRCTARMVSSRLKAKPPVTEPTGGSCQPSHPPVFGW